MIVFLIENEYRIYFVREFLFMVYKMIWYWIMWYYYKKKKKIKIRNFWCRIMDWIKYLIGWYCLLIYK